MDSKPFLLKALDLAKIRRGFCAPNPSVGAVIVSETGDILATGYHLAAGQPHAEVDALKKLNGKAPGATIYITLEPCCHFGRTPPCTNAIIDAGIKHVVYGMGDANPVVSGKSKAILAQKNISCEQIELPEITEFYRSYRYWHRTKMPYVTAKIALSLDGKIAGEKGEPIQITGPVAKKITHEYRHHSDAILTTAKTIRCDNPQLNARGEEIIAKPIYILDRELTLSLDATIFSTAKSVTLFHGPHVTAEKNIRCIEVPETNGKLDLLSVMKHIGQDGIHDLWIEAGGLCFSECVKQGIAQTLLIYVAPRWLGLGLTAFPTDFSLDLSHSTVNWQTAGDDAICRIQKIDSH